MINIAKLLKGCPKGTKLYSPLFGEVEFAEVMDTSYMPIRVMKRGYGLRFDKYGRYMGNQYPDAECLLFPSKDYHTWQGWTPCVEPKFKVGDWVVRKDGETFYGGNYAEQITLIEIDEKGKCIWFSSKTWTREDDIRPWTIADAKDGDVLIDETTNTIGIFEKIYGISWHSKIYCGNSTCATVYHDGGAHEIKFTKPATKEQRDLLFAKMQEAGYEWDKKKKELKKILKYYDISSFYAGMPVLVRADNNCKWDYSIFSRITGNEDWKFAVCNGVNVAQCIPFEGNEALLGTTDMCPEEYINW